MSHFLFQAPAERLQTDDFLSEDIEVDWGNWLIEPQAQPCRMITRRTTRYTAAQRQVLDSWMRCNIFYPYPDKFQKVELAARTELSQKQVETYLSNFRRRYLPRAHVADGEAVDKYEQFQVSEPPDDPGKSFWPRRSPSPSTSLEANPSSPMSYWSIDSDSIGCRSDVEAGCTPFPLSTFDQYGGGLLQWFLDQCNIDVPPPTQLSDSPDEMKVEWTSLRSTLSSDCLTNIQPLICSLCGLRRVLNEETNDKGTSLTFSVTEASCTCQQVLSQPIVWSDNDEGVDKPIGRPTSRPPTPNVINIVGTEVDFPRPIGRRRPRSSSQESMIPNLSAGSRGASARASSISSMASSGARSSGSFASFGSRKGRRAYSRTGAHQGIESEDLIGLERQSSLTDRFRCDGCGQRFKTNYLRNRHVSSVHTGDDRYICGPSQYGEQPLCPGCRRTEEDGCTHWLIECWRRPESARTFYRKDLLTQHLRSGWHHLTGPLDDDVLAAMHFRVVP